MDKQFHSLLNFAPNQRRSKAIGWVFALLTAWLLSLVVVEPVAAQTEIAPSTPCFTSTNLTNLSTGGNRGITNQPVISGNGNRVSFWSVNNLGGGNVDGNIEVFVRETGSNSVVQLTDSVGSILGGFNLEPSINTAGTHIAFYSDRDLVEGQNADGNFEIFLARRANNGTWTITQVTNTQGSANLFPSINAAGNRIVFVSDDSELHNIDQTRVNADRNFEIYLATIPNSGAIQFRQITNTGAGVTNDQPVINASGSRIAFTAATGQTAQVFVWDESQNAPTQLTQTDINDQASISADGTSIVYIATTTDDRNRVVLHTLSADGTESRAEVIVPAATNTKYRSPSISGNGKRVVYVSEQGTGAALQINVQLYDVNTGLGVPISEVGGGTGEQPAISSDGTRVTFVGVQAVGGSTDNTGSDIYLNECPQADLKLEFVNPPVASVLAGIDVQYQFRVTNKGPSVATDAFFHSDLSALPGLPANVNRLLPPGCTIDANDLFCPLGDIAVNASRVFTVGYDIPSNAGLADIVSQIDVGANVVDSNPADNATGQFKTRIFEESALSLAVTTNPATILAGSPDQLTYELVVTNGGPSQARSTRITDTLPTGSTFISVQLVSGGGAGANCSPPIGGVLSCDLRNLTAGSTTTIRIRVTANASAPPTLTNVATVRSLTQESNLANNTVVTQTPVERSADLAITKTASPSLSVIAGREITYTLRFTNNGFADTEDAVVIDNLPQNVTYVRSSLPSGASCTPSGGGQIVTCNFPGALLVDESRTFSFVALVGSVVPAGTITNTARVQSDRDDPNPLNNVSPGVATEVTLLADLVVSKTVNNTTPDIFEVITYTVQLRNDGPSQAYNVVVTDLLPSEMTFISYTASVGSYDDGAGLWTVGTLPVAPVGEEETLIIRAFVQADGGGDTKRNRATAGGSQPEPDNDLPSTDFVDLIAQRADIRVTKTSVPAIATHVIAGQRLTYTLTLRNLGPTLARSVLLTDALPADVFLVDVFEPGGRPACVTGATITCNVGDIVPNVNFPYTVVITRELKGMITNTVTVSTRTPDLNLVNNSQSHSILVDPDVPHNLLFTALPPPAELQTAGATFAPAPRVQIRDRFNNLINATLGQSDVIELLPFTNPTCTTPAPPVALHNRQVNAVGGEAIFASLNYTASGTIYLRALDTTRGSVEPACSTAITVNPDSVKQLVIITPSQIVTAGRRSEVITVQRQDQFGNPTIDADFVVNLEASTSTGEFLNISDVTIPSVTIPNTQSTADFYYSDTLSGTHAITVSGGLGVSSFSQAITVVPGNASALLVVVSAPPTVTAGVRSSDITIARIDDFGNENESDPTLVIDLTSSSPTPSEYDFFDDDDTTIIDTTSIVQGTSRATFSYRDTRAALRQLSFEDQGGDLAGAVMTITVVPAATHHLVFTTPPRTITAGQSSSLPVITVAREDQFNNRNFADSNLSITLSSSSTGAPDFIPDSPVTIPQNSDHVDFQYSDTLAGSFTLTALAAGLTDPDVTQSITVVAAAASKVRAETLANGSGVVVTTQNVTAGTTRQLFAITRDQFDNFIANANASWVISRTGGVLQSDISPTSGLSTVFTARQAGTAIIEPRINGLTSVASGTLTVVAGTATQLVFTQQPLTMTAGILSTVFTVQRRDQFNNPNTANTSLVVNLTTNATLPTIGGAAQFFNAAGTPPAITSVTIAANASTASFTYLDRRAGRPTITANDAGPLTAATATVSVDPAAADRVTFFAPAQVVAGEVSDVITVQVEDQFGNPVTPTVSSPVILNLTTSADLPVNTAAEFRDATIPASPITQVTIDDSSIATFRYYDTKAGTPTMTATDSGTLNLGAFNQPITVVAAAAAKVRAETLANGSGVVVTTQNVTAGQTRQLFAITRDAFDNFIANANATWVISRTGGVLQSDITPLSGASTTFTGRKVGTAIIEPRINGLTSVASGMLTVVPGAANKIRVESNAAGSGGLIPSQTISAGESIALFAVTRDAFDNFVDNPADAVWTVISRTLGVTNTDLVATGGSATFTAHKVGTGGIRATLGGVSTNVPTGLITVEEGPVAQVRAETLANGNGVVVTTQNVTAGQTRTLHAITRDQFDNFIANANASWVISRTGGVLQSDISSASGLSTVFTGRKVGTAIIEPRINGLTSVASGTLTVIAGTANKVRVESSATGNGGLIPAQTISAGQVITVYAVTRDAFDNFVANPSATWTTITRTGNVQTTDLVANGASATFTARLTGTVGIRATVGGIGTNVPTGLLTVVPGDASYLDITIGSASTGSTTAGGTQTLNITAYDAANNLATGYSGTKTLVFSGALSSTNPIEGPRVFDSSGTARNFGTNTTLTFVNGVMSHASNAGNMRLFRAGTNIQINVADVNVPGLDSAPTGTLIMAVNANTLHRLALTLANTSLTAGVPVSLTITAQDQYGNTRTDYGDNEDLIFSSTTPITAPNGTAATVRNRTGSATAPFGTATSINFDTGVATTTGGNNGVLRIYKTGSFRLNVRESDGSPTSSPGGDAGVGYLDVTVANSPNQTISLQLTSPQTNSIPFVGTNAITLTDAYLNPVTIDAATRPVVLTTSLNGIIGLSGSGNDNSLNESNDFNGSGQANLTSLGLTYTGTVGSGRITATVSSPLGGSISSGANVTINPGAPKTLTIQGRTGNNEPGSDLTVAAGTPVSLTLRAFDAGNNLTTNFDGSLSLTFNSGGSTATGTIRDSANATVTLGNATSLNFVDGVSSVQANGSNGRMVITSTGTYFVTASGSGVTTPLANAFVLTVGVGVTGSTNPEPEIPEEEVPEDLPDYLYLPTVPSNDPAESSTHEPEQSKKSTLRLPTITR